jgi:hypothetical protein
MADPLILYRPVGRKELDLIRAAGWTAFPPRLPERPIFYPVLNEEYATQITRCWNVPQLGAGYVVRFAVDAEFASKYPVQRVGARHYEELWVPAEELDEFNRHLVSPIELIAEYLK